MGVIGTDQIASIAPSIHAPSILAFQDPLLPTERVRADPVGPDEYSICVYISI